MKSNWPIRKGLIGWFTLVVIFSLLIFPSFSDYMARVQISEALSLAASLKGNVADFYEKYQYCPTQQDISDSVIEGKYVKSVQVKALKGGGRCYIIARLRQDSLVDRRVRGKSILLAMAPTSLWTSQMRCETNLTTSLVNCQQALLKE